MPPMLSPRKPIALVAALAAVTILAPSAFAGFVADPRDGDVLLGKRAGIAYVKDTETVPASGSALAPTGCPGSGDSWRIAGGGFATNRAGNLLNTSRPLDYADDDSDADDFWQAGSNSAKPGSKITGYAVCMREPNLRYASEVASASTKDFRKVSVDCPGKTEPLGGGGSISPPGSFLSSLYPSGDSWKVAAYDADGGTGNLTADVVCLKSGRIETVEQSFRVAADGSRNVKIIGEAPSMPMSNVYETQRDSTGIPNPFPRIGFESRPFDDGDRNEVPDGWRIGISNLTSEAQRVTVYSTFLDPR